VYYCHFLKTGGGMSSLEQVWSYREEVLYPELFGKMARGIFPLTFDTFKPFGEQEIDPRWLHLGVMEFKPNDSRSSWLYVTSGGSTPWDTEPEEYDVDGYSWLGVEFVIETTQQADWPVLVLQRLLAYQVLLCHGRYGEAEPLDYGDRLPAGGAIDASDDSVLRFMALAEPDHYPATGQLESGKFEFLHVIGISEAERDYAKAANTNELVEKLRIAGAWPGTQPRRASLV